MTVYDHRMLLYQYVHYTDHSFSTLQTHKTAAYGNQGITWEHHKYVTELDWLFGFQSLLLVARISSSKTTNK